MLRSMECRQLFITIKLFLKQNAWPFLRLTVAPCKMRNSNIGSKKLVSVHPWSMQIVSNYYVGSIWTRLRCSCFVTKLSNIKRTILHLCQTTCIVQSNNYETRYASVRCLIGVLCWVPRPTVVWHDSETSPLDAPMITAIKLLCLTLQSCSMDQTETSRGPNFDHHRIMVWKNFCTVGKHFS